jgi:molybdopterin/thiamine biosynthesis adenylyltransferase
LNANGQAARAHIDREGKVCVAPATGVLLDADRPEQIVAQVLDRARNILFSSDRDAELAALHSEFVAYWPEEWASPYSICALPRDAGELVLVKLRGTSSLWIAGKSRAAVEAWASHVGWNALKGQRPAFLIVLDSLFEPPGFQQATTLREFEELLRSRTSGSSWAAFSGWLEANGLPADVLVAAPSPQRGEFMLFGAQLCPAANAGHGFRPGRCPTRLQIQAAGNVPIRRMTVKRLDAGFVVTRGGGRPELLTKRVTLLGCGAVGSHVAVGLAAAGVGSLHLVDCEQLAGENVHRHVLGMAHVGLYKVDGLAESIGKRFPHVVVEPDRRDIVDVLSKQPRLMREADLVIVALGDETLERRLNSTLRLDVPRIHVWLEPLGLGGHVLVTGVRGVPGCYECLYQHDPDHGLVNMAGLTAPGQGFQRSIGGCAGTFSPYGCVDAERAAVEAVRTSIAVLFDEIAAPSLYSWVVSIMGIRAEGGRLSRRGETMQPGASRTDSDFARGDCSACGKNPP